MAAAAPGGGHGGSGVGGWPSRRSGLWRSDGSARPVTSPRWQRAAAESAQRCRRRLRASEAEAARVTADRRADELLLAQARLAIEAQPARRCYHVAGARSAARARRATGRCGRWRWRSWQQKKKGGGSGPAMTGPTDSLHRRHQPGRWDMDRGRPSTGCGAGGREWPWARKLGGRGQLAVTPDRTVWAHVSSERARSSWPRCIGRAAVSHCASPARPTSRWVSIVGARVPTGSRCGPGWRWRCRRSWSSRCGPGRAASCRGRTRLPRWPGCRCTARLDAGARGGLRRVAGVWDRETGEVGVSRHPCKPRLFAYQWTPDGRTLVVLRAGAERADSVGGRPPAGVASRGAVAHGRGGLVGAGPRRAGVRRPPRWPGRPRGPKTRRGRGAGREMSIDSVARLRGGAEHQPRRASRSSGASG